MTSEYLDNQRETKIYELDTRLSGMTIEELHQRFEDAGLTVIGCSHGKKNDMMTSEFQVIGKHDRHTAMIHALVAAPEIREFSS